MNLKECCLVACILSAIIVGVSECAAEWIDDSIDRINEVIAKVEAL